MCLLHHVADGREDQTRDASDRIAQVDETLPTTCFISGTTGHSCCMTKLLLDNRVVAGLFFVLIVVNAFAIQNGWY